MLSFNLYFLISAIFILLNGLCLFVLFKKGRSAHLSFLKFYFILSTVGILLEIAQVLALKLTWMQSWDQLANIIGIFTITFLILFIYTYIGYPKTRVAIIFLISNAVIFSILRITNEWHHQYYQILVPKHISGFLILNRSFGSAYTLMICIFLIAIVFALFRLYQLRLMSHSVFHRQLNLLIYTTAFMLLSTLVRSSNVITQTHPIITHISILPGYVFVVVALFYHTLNQKPTPRINVVEILQDGILTLNKQGIILDMNKHMRKIINKDWSAVAGKSVHTVFPVLSKKLDEIDSRILTGAKNAPSTGFRRFLFKHNDHHYDTSWYGEEDTSLVVLHDVTPLIHSIQQTSQLAQHDPLTGINNRRHIEESIKKWLEWDHSSDIPYCFILFDIDHFKQFNDQYGHQVGDEVLKQITRIFENNIRPTDMFGRFGGDEFILFLSDISEEQARQLLEKTRIMIKKHNFATEKNRRFFPTISIGGILSSSKDTLDYEELFLLADEALYQAKENGRNQSCLRRHIFIPGVTDYDETKKETLY